MKIVLLVVALTFGGLLASATTTDALELTSGGLTATIADNGTCVGTGCVSILGDLNPLAGTTTIAGSLNGWTLNIVSGTSHSPGLSPFGLDITSLTASCGLGGGCTGANDLHVLFSDINFSVPVGAGGFTTTYSDTQTGAGSTSESAYFANTNTPFLETTLIGTVGPFTGTNHGSASGGPIAAVPNYSLTLDQVFSAAGTASFSVDGNVTSVPEPAAVALLGAALLLCSSRLRRKKA
jgi:hypothetical protein